MIRFALLRFRAQAAVAVGALAILAVILAVTRIRLVHAYDTAVAVCEQQGNCVANLANIFPSQGYLTAANGLSALGLAVPGLIGMFWGAPLIARELETGTFALAWTQGVTRARWLAAKLGIVGVAATAVGELFSLMVAWWSSPIRAAQMSNEFGAGSFHAGVAPAGYAAFAFALGVTAGLFIRRTLPAMAVTLAVFTAVIIAFPIWVRPHLIPPVRTTSALSLASVAGTGSSDGHLFLGTRTATALPGAWVISSQVATAAGRAPSSEPVGPCDTPSAQACNDYIESLHFRQTVTYEPASRYWAFQWYETAIYLALAVILAGLCFLRIRPGRSEEPDIHRPRPFRAAPALERSP